MQVVLENERTSRDRFYAPGRWFLKLCTHAGIPAPNAPLAVVLIPLLLGLSLIWLELDPGWWSGGFAILFALLEGLLLYLNGAAAQVGSELQDEVWERVRRLNENATGHLALLLERFANRHRQASGNRTSKDAYHQELRDFQQHFLSHAVNVICWSLGIEPSTGLISANWCLRGSDDHANQFRVELYDRNMASRRPRDDDWKSIETNRPGASSAFLTANVALVPDTRDTEVAGFFPTSAPYRSILSVPVDCRGEVIGVVNVDSKEVNLLQIDHQFLVLQVAYLVGFCEVLRQEDDR